jgi:hypothetical protein
VGLSRNPDVDGVVSEPDSRFEACVVTCPDLETRALVACECR